MAQLDLANPKKDVAEKPQQSFAELVRSKVSTVLVGKKADDFVTALISLTQQDPALNNCVPMSLVSSALQAQSLSLSLNKALGQAWIVPFKDKKIREINPRTGEPFTSASFQIGYKGYIQLAIRSGYYKKINVLAIKQGELKNYDPLNEELAVELIQNELDREKAPTIGYYAMFEYLNGFRKTMYWSKDKMLAHADKYSQAFSVKGTGGKWAKVSFADFEAGKVKEEDLWKYSSFWYKDFDGMAFKTMIRQILTKWGIMSVEMQQAIESDMRIVSADGEITNLDTMMDAVDVEYEEVDPSPQIEEKREEKQKVPQASQALKSPQSSKIVKPESPAIKAEAQVAQQEPIPSAQISHSQRITCPREKESGAPESEWTVPEASCHRCPSRNGCPGWADLEQG